MGCVERLREAIAEHASPLYQPMMQSDIDALAELVAQVEAYCDRTFDPNGGPESDEDWAMVNALIAVLGEGRKGVPG